MRKTEPLYIAYEKRAYTVLWLLLVLFIKGSVHHYCLHLPICNLSTCFIMQVYKMNERMRYHNGGTSQKSASCFSL